MGYRYTLALNGVTLKHRIQPDNATFFRGGNRAAWQLFFDSQAVSFPLHACHEPILQNSYIEVIYAESPCSLERPSADKPGSSVSGPKLLAQIRET